MSRHHLPVAVIGYLAPSGDKGLYALVKACNTFTAIAAVRRSKLYGEFVPSADGGDPMIKRAVQQSKQTVVHRRLDESGHAARGLKGIQCA
jgi:glutamate racemase